MPPPRPISETRLALVCRVRRETRSRALRPVAELRGKGLVAAAEVHVLADYCWKEGVFERGVGWKGMARQLLVHTGTSA